jgi:deoxycytidylate deaminase
MLKSFENVFSESTCKKRVTIVEIFDKGGILLSRESNRCSPDNGECSRLGIYQQKDNYDVNSTCNWSHAEIMAIKALPEDSIPYKSVLYGHEFYCPTCESALKNAGVEILEISDKKIN